MSRNNICNNPNLTELEKWELLNGTSYQGNLPQYKKLQHVGHCWMLCPYDTRMSEARTRYMLGLSDTDPLPIKVLHVDQKEYYMETTFQGKWGFKCTYSGCSYSLFNEKPYFYG